MEWKQKMERNEVKWSECKNNLKELIKPALFISCNIYACMGESVPGQQLYYGYIQSRYGYIYVTGPAKIRHICTQNLA